MMRGIGIGFGYFSDESQASRIISSCHLSNVAGTPSRVRDTDSGVLRTFGNPALSLSADWQDHSFDDRYCQLHGTCSADSRFAWPGSKSCGG